jgi:hypothetical protein
MLFEDIDYPSIEDVHYDLIDHLGMVKLLFNCVLVTCLKQEPLSDCSQFQNLLLVLSHHSLGKGGANTGFGVTLSITFVSQSGLRQQLGVVLKVFRLLSEAV